MSKNTSKIVCVCVIPQMMSEGKIVFEFPEVFPHNPKFISSNDNT